MESPDTAPFDETAHGQESSLAAAPPRWMVVGQLTSCDGRLAAPIALRAGEVILGRQPDVGVALPSPIASRRHARLFRRGEEFLLEDLGSSNGTFVDNVPIVSCVLRDGDVVQIGGCRLWFDRVLEAGGGKDCEPCST